MSRTIRKLGWGHNYPKMYGNGFSVEARSKKYLKFKQGMAPCHWKREYHLVKSPWSEELYWDYKRSDGFSPEAEQEGLEHSAFLIHHEIYRNGSCRRQRMHGVALSKRIDHHQERAKGNRDLAQRVREWWTED